MLDKQKALKHQTMFKSTQTDGSSCYVISNPSKESHTYMVKHNYKDACDEYYKMVHKDNNI